MLRVGNEVINLDQVIFIDIDAKAKDTEGNVISGVSFFFGNTNYDGQPTHLFFCDQEAEWLKKYLLIASQNITELIGNAE